MRIILSVPLLTFCLSKSHELLILHQFLMCDWWHECCSLFCLEHLRFHLTHQENTVGNVDDGLSCRDHVKKRVEARSDHRCIQGDESEEIGQAMDHNQGKDGLRAQGQGSIHQADGHG